MMADGIFRGIKEERMKKSYETPELLLVIAEEGDVITTSGGDMPLVDAFDW